MKNDCIIRLETSKDHTEVEHLVSIPREIEHRDR